VWRVREVTCRQSRAWECELVALESVVVPWCPPVPVAACATVPSTGEADDVPALDFWLDVNGVRRQTGSLRTSRRQQLMGPR
jgi:hypothetical protein